MKVVRCECPDWAPNIEKLNAPITLAVIRTGGGYQYTGAPFRYCPWCGTTLAALRDELTEEGKDGG